MAERWRAVFSGACGATSRAITGKGDCRGSCYYYIRPTYSVSVGAGNETRLLSNGTQGTAYAGGLQFGANTFSNGDVIRVTAWGKFNNTGSNGTGRLKLYLESGGGITTPIADSDVFDIIGSASKRWYLLAEITLRDAGESGTGFCDSILECLDANHPNRMIGLGGFSIDGTSANDLELTVQVATGGTFVLEQCSVELLGTP